MDGVETENLAFLSNELNNVLDSIEKLEDKLSKEQDKLNRINESLKDNVDPLIANGLSNPPATSPKKYLKSELPST
jgi:hypothetical protein